MLRRRQWHPTPVFLPGESQGQGSLVGCRLWGHTVGHDCSDLAAVAVHLLISSEGRTSHVLHVFEIMTLVCYGSNSSLILGPNKQPMGNMHCLVFLPTINLPGAETRPQRSVTM